MTADLLGRGPAAWVALGLVVGVVVFGGVVVRRAGVVVVGAAAVGLFWGLTVVPVWWAFGGTATIYLLVLDRLAGRAELRRLRRVRRLVPPELGRCLATLPVTVTGQQHRPGEGDDCTCLAARMVPGGRAVLVVTTTSVFLHGREHAGEPAPIGEIRELTRLRLTLGDHSGLALRSRPWHGAAVFLETFRRLAEDTTLRVLLVVADRTSVGFAALRDEVRLPGGLVSSKVARLGDAGMLDVRPGRRFEITPRGYAEISGRLRHKQFANR